MSASYLAIARKTAGLTQDDVARRLGVSQVQVARWEKSSEDPERRPIPQEHIPGLAEILDVSAWEIETSQGRIPDALKPLAAREPGRILNALQVDVKLEWGGSSAVVDACAQVDDIGGLYVDFVVNSSGGELLASFEAGRARPFRLTHLGGALEGMELELKGHQAQPDGTLRVRTKAHCPFPVVPETAADHINDFMERAKLEQQRLEARLARRE